MLKITSPILRSGLVVAAVALLPITEAAAQVWDPQNRKPPFSTSRVCQIPITSTTGATIVAGPRDISDNPTGSFPLTVNCSDGNASQSGTCLRWDYKFFYTGLNPSIALVAVDSNVKVMSILAQSYVLTFPFSVSTFGLQLSMWDSSISWGNTSTELGVRFNDGAGKYSASIFTDTNARVGTVTVGFKSGKLGGFCPIAGAHMPLPGDPSLTQPQSITTTVGPCTITWTQSPDGCVSGATASPSTCTVTNRNLIVNDQVATTASCGTEIAGPFGSTEVCKWNSILRKTTCVTVP